MQVVSPGVAVGIGEEPPPAGLVGVPGVGTERPGLPGDIRVVQPQVSQPVPVVSRAAVGMVTDTAGTVVAEEENHQRAAWPEPLMESFPQMERCLEIHPVAAQEWHHRIRSVKGRQNFLV